MVFAEIGAFLTRLFDPVLSPLLRFDPWLTILIVSFAVALLSSYVYKWVTDQDLMKRLKAELKEFQAEMKTLKDQPQKLMEVQRRMMETNMKYMTQSFKPTFFTFIPLILVFSWLAAHMAYEPIMPGDQFSVSAIVENGIGRNITLEVPVGLTLISDATQKINSEEVTWTLTGDSGEYDMTFVIDGDRYTKDVLISSEREYVPFEKAIDDDALKKLRVNQDRVQVTPLPFWNGWLATYIIFSIVFSIGIRKALKIV